MKLVVKKLVILSVLVVITLLSFLSLNVVITHSKQLPKGVMISASRGVNITFEDSDNPAMQVGISGVVSANSSVTSKLSSQGFSVPTKLNYTNEGYGEVVPLEFLFGGYFVQNYIPEANHYIVISDSLSVKFFKSHDSIGQQLIIDGEKHTVCGVYKQPTNILSEFSADGLEQIYLSYSNLKGYENAVIQRFYLFGQENAFNESIIAQAQLPSNYTVQYDSLTNFNDIRQVIEQSKSVALFIFGINIICFFAYIFVLKAKKICKDISTGKFHIKHCLFSTLQILGCIVGTILVFLLVKFQLHIPSEMIPPDNIFNLSFYIKAIISTIQMQNSLGLYSFYGDYSVMLVASATMLGILLSAMFVVTWWYGVKVLYHCKAFLKDSIR